MTRFVVSAVAMGILAAVPAAAAARWRSLYSGPGPRPGPDLLYRPPAVAPQLTNHGVWRARPILVGGHRLPQGGIPLPGLPLRRPRRAPDAGPDGSARGGQPLLEAERHLHLSDRLPVSGQRGRPGRAAREAPAALDRLPGHAQGPELAAFTIAIGARRAKRWGSPPRAASRNRIDVGATNIAAASIDVGRAHVDCTVQVNVTSNGSIAIALPGCGRTVHAG